MKASTKVIGCRKGDVMMRGYKKFWVLNYTVVAIVCLVVFCGANTGQAAPLTNTELSWDQFTAIADIFNPIVIEPISFFNFEVNEEDLWFPDGSVYSQVFPGIGSASGLYVYVYQFQVDAFSDVGLTEVSFNFLIDPGTTPVKIEGIGDVTSFWINETDPEIGFSDASISPSAVSWDGGILTISFPSIAPGGISFIVGTFAPANMPPAPVVVTLGTDPTGNPIIKPSVYTPTPEPSVALLLGFGLVGPLLFRRRLV